MNLFDFFTIAALFFIYPSKADDEDPMTCGSVIKLLELQGQVRLHSHAVQYGSGSGQQSVTSISDSGDANSHWQVRPAFKATCRRGEPIECGKIVRFKHQSTGCWLHSHHFSSPLSNNQEVSCFGSENDSDTGDNWKVICSTDVWERDRAVKFKHQDTGTYLTVSGAKYGSPIHGHVEVCGSSSPSSRSEWKTMEGIYMVASEEHQ